MSAGYLLDSNTIIAAIKGEPRALLNRIMTARAIALVPVRDRVRRAAVRRGKVPPRRKGPRGPDIVVSGFKQIAFDVDDANAYSRIRTALERKDEMIGTMDCLIAAQAIAPGLVLVTDNLREFRRVPGLSCENWMR